jgi:membrane protein required for colicin V production
LSIIISAIPVAVVLVSALLSMMRGARREALAIASWAIAAFVALYFHPFVYSLAGTWVWTDWLWIASAFFATLFVVSLATVRLSDAILDSYIGPVDRSVSFFFGVSCGVCIILVFYAIARKFFPSIEPLEWVFQAPLFQESREAIGDLLPYLKEGNPPPAASVASSEPTPKIPEAPAAPTRHPTKLYAVTKAVGAV